MPTLSSVDISSDPSRLDGGDEWEEGEFSAVAMALSSVEVIIWSLWGHEAEATSLVVASTTDDDH